MKKKFKKLIGLVLCSTMLISAFTACGSKEEPSNTTEEQTSETNEGESKGTIKIATKPPVESMILAEMLGILIEENTDLDVEITKGVGGGTTNIHPAIVNGDFDLYPEYTGTAYYSVLKETEDLDTEAMYDKLIEEYDKLGLTWTGLYGFNSTYAIAVRNDVIEKYNLKTVSDLAKVSNELKFAANPDYLERADGYPLLKEAYGLNFKEVVDVDVNLKYQAIASGEVDAINAFTTDAQLAVEDVSLLEDDLHFFKEYLCSTVVRKDTLEKYPELLPVLEMMNGTLTDQKMAELNYQVIVDGKEDHDVAYDYLKELGLVK